jgi:hypothetical protein
MEEEAPVSVEEVAALVDDLEQAPWVEWGLWGESSQGTSLRIRAAEFDKSDSSYLREQAPPATPALRLQRALSRFLGRG